MGSTVSASMWIIQSEHLQVSQPEIDGQGFVEKASHFWEVRTEDRPDAITFADPEEWLIVTAGGHNHPIVKMRTGWQESPDQENLHNSGRQSRLQNGSYNRHSSVEYPHRARYTRLMQDRRTEWRAGHSPSND